MIDNDHCSLSIEDQCKLLGKSRSWYYFYPKNDPTKIKLENSYRRLILEILHDRPFYGYRKVSLETKVRGLFISAKCVYRFMREMGLQAIYQKPRLSKPSGLHKKYPYLLKGLKISYSNQVWATDITYIKIFGGFIYLVAIIDLYSRKVLSWVLSNGLDVDFCLVALDSAMENYGMPEIFNSDQGSQFTSDVFIQRLESKNVRISMDGKGRVFDNIFIERLWRTVKYEDIYLWNYETAKELKEGLTKYFIFYNSRRFHQSLEYKYPDEVYFQEVKRKAII